MGQAWVRWVGGGAGGWQGGRRGNGAGRVLLPIAGRGPCNETDPSVSAMGTRPPVPMVTRSTCAAAPAAGVELCPAPREPQLSPPRLQTCTPPQHPAMVLPGTSGWGTRAVGPQHQCPQGHPLASHPIHPAHPESAAELGHPSSCAAQSGVPRGRLPAARGACGSTGTVAVTGLAVTKEGQGMVAPGTMMQERGGWCQWELSPLPGPCL